MSRRGIVKAADTAKKAPGDSTLQALWRKVVRKEWGNRCAIPEPWSCYGPLECHHIIRRARPHLRHVPTNGILLCHYHHNEAAAWAVQIARAVGEEKMEWLRMTQRKLFPEFLAERGQTRADYFWEQKKYLTALLNGAREE